MSKNFYLIERKPSEYDDDLKEREVVDEVKLKKAASVKGQMKLEAKYYGR